MDRGGRGMPHPYGNPYAGARRQVSGSPSLLSLPFLLCWTSKGEEIRMMFAVRYCAQNRGCGMAETWGIAMLIRIFRQAVR
jgi:hypothetical protein